MLLPGRPPFRKIEGSLFLPEAVAADVQRQAAAMDERIIQPPHTDEEEQFTHSPEARDHSPSLGGGGVPSPFIFRAEEGEPDEAAEPDEADQGSDHNDQGSDHNKEDDPSPKDLGLGHEHEEKENDEEVTER